MYLGNLEVLHLNSGTFALDGGAMFGVVPKPLWEKKSAPDEKNRIRMRANSLLVRAHNKTILTETGNTASSQNRSTSSSTLIFISITAAAIREWSRTASNRPSAGHAMWFNVENWNTQ
jgi:hypothetical protein